MKKYPKTATITRGDLSRALKQPWHTTTCLLAQTAKRAGLLRLDGQPKAMAIYDKSDDAKTAMDLFDRIHNEGETKLLPKLKAMLPIKVKL